jgi:hypothetical protein
VSNQHHHCLPGYDGTPMNNESTLQAGYWPRNRALPSFVSIILISAWYFPFTHGAGLIGMLADDALYLLMADYYSPFAAAEPVVDYVHRISHLPHGYPLLLGLLGAGSAQVNLALAVQTALMIAGFALTARYAWELGLGLAPSFALLWLVAVAPSTFMFSSEIWSEFLYLLLAQSALLLALKAQYAPRWWWPCSLLVGLAAITRGAGITLLVALLVVLLIRAPQRSWPVALLGVLPLGLAEYFALGGGTGYIDVFLQRVSTPSGLIDSLIANAAAIWVGWQSVFAQTTNGLTAFASAAVLVLAFVGGLPRMRQLELDAVYAAGYLALLLLWPFPEVARRLVYPLAPLVVIFAMLGGRAIARLLFPPAKNIAGTLAPLLLLACALPDTTTMLERYTTRAIPPELEAARARRYWLRAENEVNALVDITLKQTMIDFIRDAGKMTAISDCIYALHPQTVLYHARRVSFPAPTAQSRALPYCRYHLVLSDDSFAEAYRALWPSYEVVLTAEAAGGVAGILVRYPQVREAK